ncbi:multidrug effflux MFS transporter [Thalassomonas sp. M1454]|uniref:multidrug effflux MFS transporter n=1 Tax=Thalassomonas sp. M1454 TaxID=2594477 RepID=UPI00117FC000|nr:multidrug effflux MFS transporter [Thalassomonas sp. M1454]TRX56906.1 multidrug effflux MFS transporter [Thalassomonas sp. M1454]
MTKKQMLPMLMLMVVFSPLAIDIFLPALPIMAKDLSVSLVDMQLSITVFMFSMGLGQLFTGPLTDRFGRKPIALVGIVLYILASMACVYANDIISHLSSRFIQGFGTCAIVVSAFAIVRDKYNAIESGAMYSYLNGVICCIPALAPILGGWLTHQFGWHSNFQFMAIYGVLAGLLILSFLKESHAGDSSVAVTKIPFKIYLSILRTPQFIYHSALIMLSMAVIIAYVTSSPSWLMVKLGLSTEEFIFWFSLNAVFNITACIVAPKLLERLGANILITSGLLILIFAGILMLALQYQATAINFMLPIIFSSIGFSLLMGTCAGQALEPFAKRAGTASALLGFMQMSGSAAIVGLIQLVPISEVLQISILMLAVIPFFVLWQNKDFKQSILVKEH